MITIGISGTAASNTTAVLKLILEIIINRENGAKSAYKNWLRYLPK